MSVQLEKRCPKCDIIKPIEQFSKQRQRNGQKGRRSHCKDCIKISDAAYKAACKQENPEKIKASARAYDKKRRESDSEYRARKVERNREDRARHPERFREYVTRSRLKTVYNLTEEDYRQLYQAQGGLCAICGNPQIQGRQLAIDHDHKSGLGRGLLCYHCNIGIGHFQEDITRLESAIAYLSSFELRTSDS